MRSLQCSEMGVICERARGAGDEQEQNWRLGGVGEA